jgi:hypothetical protein
MDKKPGKAFFGGHIEVLKLEKSKINLSLQTSPKFGSNFIIQNYKKVGFILYFLIAGFHNRKSRK